MSAVYTRHARLIFDVLQHLYSSEKVPPIKSAIYLLTPLLGATLYVYSFRVHSYFLKLLYIAGIREDEDLFMDLYTNTN